MARCKDIRISTSNLLLFLEKSSRPINIKEYTGRTVAIDAHCWLHRGAIEVADKLVLKQPTTQYVSYCMKYVHMLLSNGIKPILVFYGQHLPVNYKTELRRRASRERHRKEGQDLLTAGSTKEGKHVLRRAVEVTFEMVAEVIKECRKINVDCIVAPYEAGAQLAYLNLQNIADLVITDDPALLVYGCKAVLFKMDRFGDGILIEKSKLYLSLGVIHCNFSATKFRLMCILSGCDFVDALPGVELENACKFVHQVPCQGLSWNIPKALSSLPEVLDLPSLVVTEPYIQAVVAADQIFQYQLVYDPLQRKQMPKTPAFVQIKDPRTAFMMALGNLHPKTLELVSEFDPDDLGSMQPINPTRAPHKSIWTIDGRNQPAVKVPVNFSKLPLIWTAYGPTLKGANIHEPMSYDPLVLAYANASPAPLYPGQKRLTAKQKEILARPDSEKKSLLETLEEFEEAARETETTIPNTTTRAIENSVDLTVADDKSDAGDQCHESSRLNTRFPMKSLHSSHPHEYNKDNNEDETIDIAKNPDGTSDAKESDNKEKKNSDSGCVKDSHDETSDAKESDNKENENINSGFITDETKPNPYSQDLFEDITGNYVEESDSDDDEIPCSQIVCTVDIKPAAVPKKEVFRSGAFSRPSRDYFSGCEMENMDRDCFTEKPGEATPGRKSEYLMEDVVELPKKEMVCSGASSRSSRGNFSGGNGLIFSAYARACMKAAGTTVGLKRSSSGQNELQAKFSKLLPGNSNTTKASVGLSRRKPPKQASLTNFGFKISTKPPRGPTSS